MCTINNTLRIRVEQGVDAECCMHRFLRSYLWAPIELLMRRPARDSIPAGTSWRPGEIDMQLVQDKRRSTNDQASKDRRAASPTIVVEDTVVICDRYPGWKFHTPCKKERWKVTHVQGTLGTAMRGQNQVTRNVAWFKKATPGPTSPDEESEVEDSGVPGTSDSLSSMTDEGQASPPGTDKTLDTPAQGHSMVTRSRDSLSQMVLQPRSSQMSEGQVRSH